MSYLMGQILALLIGALLIGFVLGWLFRSLFRRGEMARLERTWKINLSSKEQDFAAMRRKLEAKNGNLSALKDDDLRQPDQPEAAAKTRDSREGKEVSGTNHRDDLQTINGIGPILEKRLNELGIFTYAQIADLDDNHIDRLAEQIGAFPDRIRRDQWVEKARALL